MIHGDRTIGMIGVPETLSAVQAGALYDLIDELRQSRRACAWDRSEQGYYHRRYCDGETQRIKAELKRRGLRVTRPGMAEGGRDGKPGVERAGGMVQEGCA